MCKFGSTFYIIECIGFMHCLDLHEKFLSVVVFFGFPEMFGDLLRSTWGPFWNVVKKNVRN